MKKLFFLMLCLACFGGFEAQNVWKTINCNATFLGADNEGNLFAMAGSGGLIRSQDDGATWTRVLDHYMSQVIAFSPQGRVFAFPSDYNVVFYSDDHGDSWGQSFNYAMPSNAVLGAYTVSNDIWLLWTENQLCYTLDAGDNWGYADLSFIDEEHWIGDVIANEAGDVYLSKWTWSGYESGIYHSTLSDMQNWVLAAFDGAVVLHMEFDPEGNVLAGSDWGGIVGFQHEPGFYLLRGSKFVVADNGMVYNLSVAEEYYTVLQYSGDHGETFYDYGEPVARWGQQAPGGLGDGTLRKGRDGHLYLDSRSVYWKSVFDTRDIHYLEGEVVRAAVPCGPGGADPNHFALRTDDGNIYRFMVNGFWPNPFLDDLVVRYDTIPEQSVIGVFGTLSTTVGYYGDTIQILEIQQTTAHYYDAIISIIDPMSNPPLEISRLVPPYETYLLTHNGEPMTNPSLNGVYFGEPRFIFVGHCGVQDDLGLTMELKKVIPFDMPDFNGEGYMTTEYDGLLSFVCDNTPYYLKHNGQFFYDNYINNDIFGEYTTAYLQGVPNVYYKMNGDPVKTLELNYLRSDDETTLTGTVEMVPMPNLSYVPLPGLEFGLVSNGKTYYLNNIVPYEEFFVVGNDTVYEGQQITATFTPQLNVDYGLNIVYRININTVEHVNEIFPLGTEWYYEIQNPNGALTYQHLEYASDTAINSRRAKVLVRTNTQYDKGLFNEVCHEYIYENGDLIYWWNATQHDFTLLYDFGATTGDEWTITVEETSFLLHVDGVDTVEYKGDAYRVLHVSDLDGYFSGDILCGVGHLTSFFPESLMKSPDAPDHAFTVDGLRCYWQDGELVLTLGNEDCDAIYDELHQIAETLPDGFRVYPNPSDGLLTVEAFPATSPASETSQETSLQGQYRVTNLMGQTLMSGVISASSNRIDVSSLPNGLYFLLLNNHSQKIVIQR